MHNRHSWHFVQAFIGGDGGRHWTVQADSSAPIICAAKDALESKDDGTVKINNIS
jgi:hypothetical protein